jgi:hypothetical protein
MNNGRMNSENKRLHLYLKICLRCHTLPVQYSSWEAGGDMELPYCVLHDGEKPEMVRMSIAIPISLLRDEAYSKVALRIAEKC